MKKRFFIAFIALLAVLLCSCKKAPPKDTTLPSETNFSDSSSDTQNDVYDILYGEWINELGESEPIDENTVNGTPYTLKSAVKNERGDITYILTVNNSDVKYTVYRYKVGYAEYSYMEAVIGTKDAVFKFSK